MKRSNPFLEDRINEIKNKRLDYNLNKLCDDIMEIDFNNNNNNNNNNTININENNKNIVCIPYNIKNNPFDNITLIYLTDICSRDNEQMINEENDSHFEDNVWKHIQSFLCSQNNDNIKIVELNNITTEFNNKYKITQKIETSKILIKIYIKFFIELRNLKLELIDSLLISYLQNYKININMYNKNFNYDTFRLWSEKYNKVIINCKNYVVELINNYDFDNFDFINHEHIKNNNNNFINYCNSINIIELFNPLKDYFNFKASITLDDHLLKKIKSKMTSLNKLIDILFLYHRTGIII